MNRYFDLYLTAGHSVPVVINANQYDSSETWIFTLYTEDDQLYTPASGSIVGLKSDGHTIANAGTVNNDGQVVIQETVQITAAKGINIFELVLNGNHGTANFVVLVEPRPGDNATPSDSELTLMEQAIAAAGTIGSVSALTDIVNAVNSRMNEFIADHAGLSTETVLWTGNLFKTYQSPSVTPTGGKATLSQKATDFDYIGVYTTMNTLGDDQTADVHWYNADEFAEKPTMVTCGTTKAYSGATDWVAIPYITLLMDSDEVTCTVFNAGLVSWNGQAESNATSQTSEGTTNYQGSVVKIVGIKNTQNDSEVIDARVGADGTVYNTLEARLNAENSALKSALDDIEEQIEGGTGSGLTDQAKQALLTMFQHVAFSGDDPTGRTYYNALYDALYPAIVVTKVTLNTNSLSFGSLNSTQQLTATTTPSGGAITWSSSNTSVATVSATGLVTAVGYGNTTITATSGGKSATCAVTIAQATVTSISANYTQSGTVLDSASLDDLKSDLVVTANWSNGTSSTVASADYTLSGTLTAGTSTVTVSYGGQTATFNVTVTENPNITYDFTFVENEYISGSDGTIGSSNSYSRTVPTSAKGASKIYVPAPLAGMSNVVVARAQDESSTTFAVNKITEASEISMWTASGKYIALSSSRKDLIVDWASGIYGTKEDAVFGWTSGVAYDTFEIVAQSYLKLPGYPAYDASWCRTKAIDCHGASSIHFAPFNDTAKNSAYNYFYDENFTKISQFTLTTAGATITVPENAYYFCVSGAQSAVQGFVAGQTIPYGGE